MCENNRADECSHSAKKILLFLKRIETGIVIVTAWGKHTKVKRRKKKEKKKKKERIMEMQI